MIREKHELKVEGDCTLKSVHYIVGKGRSKDFYYYNIIGVLGQPVSFVLSGRWSERSAALVLK